MRKSEKNIVRVVTGSLKGQKILTPGEGTHPMGSREKIALFNMVMPKIAGATVLDAYAGSGALGIEALSRGAKKVVFVEKAKKAGKIILENLKNLSLEGKVYNCAVKDFAEKYGADDEKYRDDGEKYGDDDVFSDLTCGFDIIFADPPYDNFQSEEVGLLAKYLKDDGVLVLSHPYKAPKIDGLFLVKSNPYANAHLSIYKKQKALTF